MPAFEVGDDIVSEVDACDDAYDDASVDLIEEKDDDAEDEDDVCDGFSHMNFEVADEVIGATFFFFWGFVWSCHNGAFF